MNIRPSSLPMLAACPCFESDDTRNESNDPDLSDGTKRHRLFAAMIAAKTGNSYGVDKAIHDSASPEDREACEWAADYFMLHAPLNDYPWSSEVKRSFLLPDFSTIEGTPDAVCGNQLFDLKSRRRNYRAQMAAYALMIFEAHPEFTFVRVHILFAIGQTFEVYEITREEAMKEVWGIIDDGPTRPKACDYCGWCKHQLTCAANVGPAKQVATGYSDGAIDLTQWHPSQITDGKELAIGLAVADIVTKWAASMKHHALNFMMRGNAIPGYKLGESQGKIHCNDVASAFSLAALPQADFLASCTLRLNTSKDYPDRVGLVEAYAKANNLPKSKAKKELTAKLAGVLSRGKPSPKLVKDGEDSESEE